jgi:hypothetical protein
MGQVGIGEQQRRIGPKQERRILNPLVLHPASGIFVDMTRAPKDLNSHL